MQRSTMLLVLSFDRLTFSRLTGSGLGGGIDDVLGGHDLPLGDHVLHLRQVRSVITSRCGFTFSEI